MPIIIRPSKPDDLSFMQAMLYEAVFWRDSATKPTVEEALTMPEIIQSLAAWGERTGDTAVIAEAGTYVDGGAMGFTSVGAAWFRYWTDESHINGYVDAQTPVIVIAVHAHYRRQGIGTDLMAALIASARDQSIPQLSLSVAKDNHAYRLYVRSGFVQVADTGTMFIMCRAHVVAAPPVW